MTPTSLEFSAQCVCVHVCEQEVTAVFMFTARCFSTYSARPSLLCVCIYNGLGLMQEGNQRRNILINKAICLRVCAGWLAVVDQD